VTHKLGNFGDDSFYKQSNAAALYLLGFHVALFCVLFHYVVGVCCFHCVLSVYYVVLSFSVIKNDADDDNNNDKGLIVSLQST